MGRLLGILDGSAPELMQGCRSYGAHFVDDDDVANVVKAFVRLRPEQMQFHAKARRGGFLRPGSEEDGDGDATVTRLVDGGVQFLNRPGFAGGGCAAHRRDGRWRAAARLEAQRQLAGAAAARALDRRERPRDVPAARVEAPRLGRGREEFHWWCTESPEAFIGKDPVPVVA